ncbi:MAG: DUF1800 domain-containing protein [Bacteroidetes bacterium]|nr:DUF1800 domain-containing protein [Bacteroidota bacterium]
MDPKAPQLSSRLTQENTPPTVSPSDNPIVMNPPVYSGPWTRKQAAHLLRRATYGMPPSMIEASIDYGLDGTIDLLLADQPLPDPPLNYYFEDDPYVPIGETWIDTALASEVSTKKYKRDSIRAWTIGNILQEGISVREKMTLFWHNHFVISEINDPRFEYTYITLLRSHAFGNFKTLTKAVCIDPAMLRYLNGNQNTLEAPNENFARELLELFTIGKGPLIGPGDYTNYTENDIAEIAKIMTGWKDVGFSSSIPGEIVGSVFDPVLHDESTKVLSYHFDFVEIPNSGANEYKDLIEVIFQQFEVARFICRRLYRWFVYYEINDTIESEIIEPLAQLLYDNDYEIKPVLEALFKSAHFYSKPFYGAMIKNPLDFTISLIKPFEIVLPEDLGDKYKSWLLIFDQLEPLQMHIFQHPAVAGWKAYYQAPLFYRHWTTAVTLPERQK